MNSCSDENVAVCKEGDSTQLTMGENKVLHRMKNFAADTDNDSLSSRGVVEELNVLNINKRTISVALNKTISRSTDETTNVDIYTVEFDECFICKLGAEARIR